MLGGVLELDALAGQRADAGGVGIAAAGIVGGDGVVVLLEVDDGDLEVALAEPVGGILFLGRAGGDANRKRRRGPLAPWRWRPVRTMKVWPS